ncbi:MAG: LPS export ABC transporter periplasmic protein LptC [Phyllobacteriaceae bacterium]|nr:LPS export ABC transporter periplasmic protein LptC [Phyllobacteriaceae bacterium]
MKRGLPVAAFGVAAFFVLWSWAARPALPIAVKVDGAALTDGKLVMSNPELGGVNKDNQRYSMKAARAIQDAAKADLIELEEIDADLPVSGVNRARIIAERGVYDRSAGTMDIDTPFAATTTDGMIAKFFGAKVDMNTGSLATDRPVDIVMRDTHVTADSMSVADRGGTIVFERRVRLTIAPQAVRRSGETGAENDGQ